MHRPVRSERRETVEGVLSAESDKVDILPAFLEEESYSFVESVFRVLSQVTVWFLMLVPEVFPVFEAAGGE